MKQVKIKVFSEDGTLLGYLRSKTSTHILVGGLGILFDVKLEKCVFSGNSVYIK